MIHPNDQVMALMTHPPLLETEGIFPEDAKVITGGWVTRLAFLLKTTLVVVK